MCLIPIAQIGQLYNELSGNNHPYFNLQYTHANGNLSMYSVLNGKVSSTNIASYIKLKGLLQWSLENIQIDQDLIISNSISYNTLQIGEQEKLDTCCICFINIANN